MNATDPGSVKTKTNAYWDCAEPFPASNGMLPSSAGIIPQLVGPPVTLGQISIGISLLPIRTQRAERTGEWVGSDLRPGNVMIKNVTMMTHAYVRKITETILPSGEKV
jgi:hypothetical protein